MKTRDLYDILGVPRDAKPRDLKAAYRKRAAAAHPDKGGSDEELQAINEAWETLSDPEKRRRYDETGEIAGAAAAMSPGEARFLAALDEVLHGMLGDPTCRVVNLAATVKRSLSLAKSKTVKAIEATEEALAKVEKQIGRYRLIEDSGYAYEGEENLIESRLLAVKGDLVAAITGLHSDLRSYRDALVCCDRYEDANPEPTPVSLEFSSRTFRW